jgi:proline iminopeptidase
VGCGNSDTITDTSLLTVERFAQELGEVRAALGLSRVHILGQSWGSMLAVDYMLTQEPVGVQSLILSGPCLSAPRWGADQRAYVDRLPEKSRNAILDNEAKKTYDAPEYQEALMEYYRLHVCRLDSWPDVLMQTFNRVAADVYGYMWGPSEFTITGTLGTYDRVARLKEIAVPVLFTCGEYDEATPAATAWYKDNLPGSEMIVFEGASHEHHLEKREEYLEAVRGFLGKVEKRRKITKKM